MSVSFEQQFSELLEIKNIILEENMTYNVEDVEDVFEIDNVCRKNYEMVGNFITTVKVNNNNLSKSKRDLEVLRAMKAGETNSLISTIDIDILQCMATLDENQQKVLLDEKNYDFIMNYKQQYLDYMGKVNKMCKTHLFPFVDLPVVHRIKNIGDVFFSDVDYYNFLEQIFKKIQELSSHITKYRVLKLSDNLLNFERNDGLGVFDSYGNDNFLKLFNSHYKFKNHYSLQDSPNEIKFKQNELISYVKCLYILLKVIKTTYRLLNTVIDNLWIDKQFDTLFKKYLQNKYEYNKTHKQNSLYYQPTNYWEYFMSNFYSTRIKDNKTFIIRPFGFTLYMDYWFENNKICNDFYKTSFKYENGKQEVVDFVLFLFSTTEKTQEHFYNPLMIEKKTL
jgi:hypothetical protein